MRLLLAAAPWLAAAMAMAQVSPFEQVEWGDGPAPRVMVDGRWWEPVSIAGVPYEALLARARERYVEEPLVRKRLDEDLLEVLGLCGVAVEGNRVDLRLRPAEGGEVVAFPGAEMTKENRQRLRAERAAASVLDPPAFLRWAEAVIAESHSYSAARGVDVGAEFGALRESLGADADASECVRAVRRVIALSGDRHAQLAGRWVREADEADARLGAMSVALAPLDLAEGGRVVAVRDGGEGLVDPERPFVVAIDGVEIEQWLDIAAELVAGGSAQRRREGACGALARPGWIRERLGLAPAWAVVLTLASPDGSRRDVTVGLTDEPAGTYRKGPGRARSIGGIEYLPITEMWGADDSPSGFAAVRAGLERACRADGLVIDIRGNGGGSRDVLHLVASYLLAPDAEPVVYSAARALMWPGRDEQGVEDEFARRYLFTPEHERWSERERRAIGEFLGRFEPEVELSADRFGPLHVSMLSPGGEGGGRLSGKPVVILMDERCASASDLFLAGMRRIPGVTLVGRPSSGASGMSVWHESPGAAIRLSTMVSFTSDGRVLDWHGVPAHVPIELAPADFTREGPDTALAAALEIVRAKAARPEGR